MDAKIQEEAKAFRSQSSTGQSPGAALPSGLEQRWQQRTDIINSHIDQLRVALGEASFQKLDRYVHGNFQPVTVPVPGVPASAAQDKLHGRAQ